MTNEINVAKIYIRSLVGIVIVGAMVCYGMYLGQVDPNVQVVAIGAVTACVLFDKPKIPDTT